MFTYEVKSTIFTALQEKAYHLLTESLSEDYHVLPHVSVGAFVNQIRSSEHHRILTHACAFLVVDDRQKPVFVVEWKDDPEAAASEIEHHRYVAQAYEECGLPVLVLQEEHLYQPELLDDEVKRLLHTGSLTRVERFSRSSNPPSGGKEYKFFAASRTHHRSHTSVTAHRCVAIAWVCLSLTILSIVGIVHHFTVDALLNSKWLLIPYAFSITATLVSVYPFRYRKRKTTLLVGAFLTAILILASTVL